MRGPERVAAAFAARRERGEAALITYLMGGDPDIAGSRALGLACLEGGADLLEIGFPFSDPIADGPTIQAAGARALRAGATPGRVLDLAASIRERTGVPIALMGYLNPVLAYGETRFLDHCVRAGVDALILPDLPPEEAEGFSRLAAARGVGMVFLLAPTSTEARRAAACAASTAFVYFVSVTGVTGARPALPRDLGRHLAAVRAVSPVPVAVGFGVSTPAQAGALGRFADGVVVGSAIVSRAAQGGSRPARAERVRRFVRSLARTMRRGAAPTAAGRPRRR